MVILFYVLSYSLHRKDMYLFYKILFFIEIFIIYRKKNLFPFLLLHIITVNSLTLPPSHRYYLVIWNFNCIFVAFKQ